MQKSEDELPETVLKEKNKAANYRWYLLTINNPNGTLKQNLEKLEATYACGQIEEGEERKTIHIQAIAYYVKARRPSSFKKIGHAIGIPAKDAQQVRNYCRKSRTRVEGPLEIGVWPEKSSKSSYADALECAKEGRITDIDPEVLIRNLGNLQKIAALYLPPYEHDDVRGVWFVGSPGTGKSYTARQRYPLAYSKSQNKWWDNYQGQHSVILDDLDTSGSCLGHLIKIWADRYACTGEIKGASVQLQHRVFVVTSNYTIAQLWPSDVMLVAAIERRFKVEHFSTQFEKDLVNFINLEE